MNPLEPVVPVGFALEDDVVPEEAEPEDAPPLFCCCNCCCFCC